MEEPETSSAQDRPAEGSSHCRAHARARRNPWLLVIGGLVLLAWLGQWGWARWTHVYIDDARIDGEVVTLSSRVSGWITELPVVQGDAVKKGALLAQVDDRDSRLQKRGVQSELTAIDK